jgi:hypothetical protein
MGQEMVSIPIGREEFDSGSILAIDAAEDEDANDVQTRRGVYRVKLGTTGFKSSSSPSILSFKPSM